MRVTVRLILAALLVVVLAAGCNQDQGGSDTNGQDNQSDNGGDEENGDLTLATVEEWAASGHARVIAFAAAEEECVRCHDGEGFAEGVEDPAELDRDWVVSTDCRACHTGRGTEIASDGSVDIASAEGLEGGMGALCMECHNARRAPNPEPGERLSSPHYGPQADVLFATGGMPIDGAEYMTDHPHQEIEDSCVSCHMLTPEDGALPSHTFKVDDYDQACESGECHGDAVGPDEEAQADYDGDGDVEAYGDEIDGLMEALAGAISESVEGTFTSESGQIVFKDSSDTTVTPSTAQYSAAWNYLLLKNDKSQGIHNPVFTVSVLQETYSAFAGEDSPGEPMEVDTGDDDGGGDEDADTGDGTTGDDSSDESTGGGSTDTTDTE